MVPKDGGLAGIQKGTEAEIYPCWAPQIFGPSVAPCPASFSIWVFHEMGSPLLAEGGCCWDFYRDLTIQPLTIANIYFRKNNMYRNHEELAESKSLGNIWSEMDFSLELCNLNLLASFFSNSRFHFMNKLNE